jgi:hypothetical protein
MLENTLEILNGLLEHETDHEVRSVIYMALVEVHMAIEGETRRLASQHPERTEPPLSPEPPPPALPDPCHDGSYLRVEYLGPSHPDIGKVHGPNASASNSPDRSHYWCTRCERLHPSGSLHIARDPESGTQPDSSG